MAGGSEATKAQLRVASEQRFASKQQLLTPVIRHDEPFIESLGAHIRIKSMTFGRREEIKTECGLDGPEPDLKKLTSLSIVECLEEPKLTMKDVEALEAQDAAIIDEIGIAVSFINLPGGGAEEGKDSSKRTQTSDSDSS